jgi:metal-sulfur cluster biosynthetic enzyme
MRIDMGEIEAALRMVEDPEIGFDVLSLGLIYDIEIKDEQVEITYSLTTMGCPYAAELEEDIRAAVAQVDGVAKVDTKLVFIPPWGIEMVDEDVRFALGL